MCRVKYENDMRAIGLTLVALLATLLVMHSAWMYSISNKMSHLAELNKEPTDGER